MKAHEILKDHFERKKRKGYSLRALARDLGVSPAFVSNVFSGKKKAPLKLVQKAAKVLDLDSVTVLEIRRQLQEHDPFADAPAAKKAGAQTRWKPVSRKGLSALRHWYYLAAMEATSCKGFDGSAAYIARRLGLPPSTVEVTLRDLVALGLLEEKDGKVRKPTRHLDIASAESKAEIRSFHRQHLRLADTELENPDPAAFDRRLITGITVTADRARIEVAKKMLADALYEIGNYLSEGEPNEVYHLGAQLVPLTKKD